MRLAIAILPLALAGACSAPPPPAATYEQPSDAQAMKAFRFALANDSHATGAKVREMRESDFTAFGYQSGVANNNNLIESRHGSLMVGALQRLNVVDCAWQPFSSEGLPAVSKGRIKDTAPRAAYRCTFEAHYQINPPHGKKLSTETAG